MTPPTLKWLVGTSSTRGRARSPATPSRPPRPSRCRRRSLWPSNDSSGRSSSVTLRTEYEFVLPRGYMDDSGAVHTHGIMRLATARDELEPLRDPTISSPDDPRLTILVLARVVRTLGSLELVTPREIEGLFAADLAYLQDFYGVINFGTPEDIDALLDAQRQMAKPAAAPAV